MMVLAGGATVGDVVGVSTLWLASTSSTAPVVAMAEEKKLANVNRYGTQMLKRIVPMTTSTEM